MLILIIYIQFNSKSPNLILGLLVQMLRKYHIKYFTSLIKSLFVLFVEEWDPHEYLVPKTVSPNSLLCVMSRGHHGRVDVVVRQTLRQRHPVRALSIAVNVGGSIEYSIGTIESTVEHSNTVIVVLKWNLFFHDNYKYIDNNIL